MIANDNDMPTLNASWAGKRSLQELRHLIDCATNTMEPPRWPDWLVRLDKELDALLAPPEPKTESARCKPKEFALVRVDYLAAAAGALRFRAHDSSAHSQEPEYFTKESTYDWSAANVIDFAILKAKEKQ